MVGANGSGKSTLLRVLRGDQWLDPLLPGRRRFWSVDDEPSASPIGARERMALVGPEGQDEYARAELDLPVEAVIRSGLDGARYPVFPASPERTALVERAASAMAVAPLLRRRFLSLSRGEARRVLVARALAPGPEVLLLDEVCDGLDLASRQALLERIAGAAAGVTVVTATHREEEIFPGVARVLRLARRTRDGGRSVQRPFVRRPVRAASGRTASDRAASGRAASGRAASGRAASGRTSADRAAAAPLVFDLSDVTVLVDGRPVLDRVTWSVRAGEAWGVTGPNGAGKSTLVRLLAGEEQPATGTIHRLDLGPAPTPARSGAGWARSRQSCRLATGSRRPASRWSSPASSARSAWPSHPRRRSERRQGGRWPGSGSAHLRERRFLACSYGEQRLLLLARALVARPEALLLDEPFAGLSPEARHALAGTLSGLRREGTTLVLVSHHEDELEGLVNRRARLAGGRFEPGP